MNKQEEQQIKEAQERPTTNTSTQTITPKDANTIQDAVKR